MKKETQNMTAEPTPAPLSAEEWKSVADLMERRWKDSENMRGDLVRTLWQHREALSAAEARLREAEGLARRAVSVIETAMLGQSWAAHFDREMGDTRDGLRAFLSQFPNAKVKP